MATLDLNTTSYKFAPVLVSGGNPDVLAAQGGAPKIVFPPLDLTANGRLVSQPVSAVSAIPSGTNAIAEGVEGGIDAIGKALQASQRTKQALELRELASDTALEKEKMKEDFQNQLQGVKLDANRQLSEEKLDILRQNGIDKAPRVLGENGYVQSEDTGTGIPYTQFSKGKAVGGPDESQDKNTNAGKSATGANLTEGVVAVNTDKYPLGTIFQDKGTGFHYIAADVHGNKNPNVVDFYKHPENYNRESGKKDLEVVGQIDRAKIPTTPQGITELLANYGQKQPAVGPLADQPLPSADISAVIAATPDANKSASLDGAMPPVSTAAPASPATLPPVSTKNPKIEDFLLGGGGLVTPEYAKKINQYAKANGIALELKPSTNGRSTMISLVKPEVLEAQATRKDKAEADKASKSERLQAGWQRIADAEDTKLLQHPAIQNLVGKKGLQSAFNKVMAGYENLKENPKYATADDYDIIDNIAQLESGGVVRQNQIDIILSHLTPVQKAAIKAHQLGLTSDYKGEILDDATREAFVNLATSQYDKSVMAANQPIRSARRSLIDAAQEQGVKVNENRLAKPYIAPLTTANINSKWQQVKDQLTNLKARHDEAAKAGDEALANHLDKEAEPLVEQAKYIKQYLGKKAPKNAYLLNRVDIENEDQGPSVPTGAVLNLSGVTSPIITQ